MASDVIIAGATPALVALRRETRTLPLVFEQVSDPVRLDFVASLASPTSARLKCTPNDGAAVSIANCST